MLIENYYNTRKNQFEIDNQVDVLFYVNKMQKILY